MKTLYAIFSYFTFERNQNLNVKTLLLEIHKKRRTYLNSVYHVKYRERSDVIHHGFFFFNIKSPTILTVVDVSFFISTV